MPSLHIIVSRNQRLLFKYCTYKQIGGILSFHAVQDVLSYFQHLKDRNGRRFVPRNLLLMHSTTHLEHVERCALHFGGVYKL